MTDSQRFLRLGCTMLALVGCGGGDVDLRAAVTAAAQTGATAQDLASLIVRDRELAGRITQLERASLEIPDAPPTGCFDLPEPEGDLGVTYDNDALHCGEGPCRQAVERVMAFTEKPSVCSGDVCKYLGNIAYLLVRPDGTNANVIIYASVSNDALHEGSQRLCKLWGIRIDTVSGSLRYHIVPTPGEREYRFDRAPVLVVYGYDSEPRVKKGCRD